MPKNNLNLRIKTEPVAAGATVNVRLLFTFIWHRSQKKSVATGFVFYAKIQIIFGTVYGSQAKGWGEFR